MIVVMRPTATQEEARKLSAALRRGAGVQGRWGEQTLRNVLEAAGLPAVLPGPVATAIAVGFRIFQTAIELTYVAVATLLGRGR